MYCVVTYTYIEVLYNYNGNSVHHCYVFVRYFVHNVDGNVLSSHYGETVIVRICIIIII